MENIFAYFRSYFENFYIAVPGIRDIIEIAILSLAIYKVMQWFMNSRAWTLLKGVVIILLFMVFAAVLRLNTILYILKNAFSVGIIAIIILFQPELSRGLEELGKITTEQIKGCYTVKSQSPYFTVSAGKGQDNG